MEIFCNPWWGLCAAAFLGGALNAVAGGGSFVVFPALLASGMSPVLSNATTTFVMWPGTLASILAYRDELRGAAKASKSLALVSLLGGGVGALLLLSLPAHAFMRAVPFLMLLAAGVFTWGQNARLWLARRRPLQVHAAPGAGIVVLQGVLAIYGGFFGAGLGIMMLSVLVFAGMRDMHQMNAMKAVLGAVINVASVVAFAMAGAIAWKQGFILAVAAMGGGYLGARLGRRCPPSAIRYLVLLVAWSMTAYFAWKGYHAP